jgi:predicted amidohydrolase YtcJ
MTLQVILPAAVLASVIASAAFGQSPQTQAADLIVTNAKVFTMDRKQPQATPPTAFAVKDGKFIAVGSDAQMIAPSLKGEKSRVIDAQGRTIIPGLNDSHLHATRGGRFYNLELRWDPPGGMTCEGWWLQGWP